jgi:hypothetical protein
VRAGCPTASGQNSRFGTIGARGGEGAYAIRPAGSSRAVRTRNAALTRSAGVEIVVIRLARPAVIMLVALVTVLAAPAALGQRAGEEPGPAAAASVVLELAGGVAEEAATAQARIDAGEAPAEERTEPPTLSEQEATAIADTSSKLQDWIEDHPVARTAAEYERDEDRYKVSYVSKDGAGEETVEAQVFVRDDEGEIAEVRTGPQVAWMMARGVEGAFGRAVNRPAIWLGLCAIFLLPLLTPRRLLSIRTLDLLVLLSLGISLIWFNRGEIFTSVPLVYPPLVYLALRLAWIGAGTRRRRGEAPDGAPRARMPSVVSLCPPWLLVTLLAITLALRYGLNAFDSNVIDVGYAGVIGADLVTSGETPYGNMPSDCGHCDTYGPLNYAAYVPFELVMPWGGTWDDLPAAHGAATAFDVLTLMAMIMIGWQLAGPRLGLVLGLAWAAFPFSAYVLETNANDSLVAAMLAWGLVAARSPVGRGLGVGLAAAAKLSPALLLPLWSRHPYPRGGGGALRRLAGYALGLAGAVALTGWVLLLDGLDGVRAFWSRTVQYQLDRESPFSIWGQYESLRPVQLALMVVVAVAAVAVLRWPRRLDLLGMAALSGALVIGFQLTLTHWFYLYIAWFLPFVLLAIVPAWERPPRPEDDAAEPSAAPLRAPAPAPVETAPR